jgi:hypothetical protein
MIFAVVIVFFILIVDLQSILLALRTFLPLLAGLVLTGSIMAFLRSS